VMNKREREQRMKRVVLMGGKSGRD
jgi:hypothetical protein